GGVDAPPTVENVGRMALPDHVSTFGNGGRSWPHDGLLACDCAWHLPLAYFALELGGRIRTRHPLSLCSQLIHSFKGTGGVTILTLTSSANGPDCFATTGPLVFSPDDDNCA
ncbi:hypothetical protein LNM18_004552, partial [Salmonella enterica subsp. enterica serovar Ealing]|nr:hypothetical protein [Salmonella enterica subsp. enterica serovar Ealing]